MYFNNVHILIYLALSIVGLIVGKIVAWCNNRLPEKKKVFSKDFFEANKIGLDNNYIFMIITAMLYIAILYKFGIKKDEFFRNLELIKYIVLVPMLLLTLSIDIKHRIIPNRLNLTIFETGLIFTFVYGITNVNMAKEYVLGMIVGAGIFTLVTILGRIIFGKEAMGVGDIKFMGATGLFYGMSGITEISLLSFFIAALVSILVILIRTIILRKKDEYIPFGPFLAFSSIVYIFLPTNTIFNIFLDFCAKISYKFL